MMGTEVTVDEGGSEVTVNTSAPAVVEVQTETVVTIEVLVAGPQGPAGAPSTVPGPAGQQGEQGEQGIQGPAGPEGPQGPVGPAGPQGPTGPKGDPGDAGPQGIQGPAGPAGADGAPGAAGPQGPAGADGATGPQGPAGPQGPPGDPATNLVTSVNAQQGDVVLGAHDVGALPATQITGGHAVAGPVAFAEVVITSSGDLDDPPLGTPRVVVDNTSLQHVVVSADAYSAYGHTYTYQCVSSADGVAATLTKDYNDGYTLEHQAVLSYSGVEVTRIATDEYGQQEGYAAALNTQGIEITRQFAEDDTRRFKIRPGYFGFIENATFELSLPPRSGTLALAEEDNNTVLVATFPEPAVYDCACATTPSGGDPRVTLAKGNVNAHGPTVLGVVTAIQGSNATVRSLGPVTNLAWTWTPLQPIYLGNGGELTQTPPDSSTCAFLLSVGVALTGTTMWVRIGEPINFGVADLPDA